MKKNAPNKIKLKLHNKPHRRHKRCIVVDDAYRNTIAAIGFYGMAIGGCKTGIVGIAFKCIAVRLSAFGTVPVGNS